MNKSTVTMPMKEYQEDQRLMNELHNACIEKFIKKEYQSLERNEYTVSLDMERLNEYLDKKYPDRQNIVYGKPKFSNNSSQPLLSITLQDESSVPTVIYKGEEVKHKISVSFEWETDTDVTMGGASYSVEHAEVGKGYPTINRIERRVKGHA